MPAKRPVIFPHAYVSTCSVTGPLIFSSTYKILSNAALQCSNDCISILDHASTTSQLKIKEAIHIQWEKPTLNHQLYHVNLKLSL